jgi:hypothetical protein
MFAFGPAEPLKLQLRSAFSGADLRAVVLPAAFFTLEPCHFSFAFFSHTILPYRSLTVN